MNIRYFSLCTIPFVALCLNAAEPIRITVLDPSKAPIPQARVAVREPVGVAGECVTDRTGACEFNLTPSKDATLFVTADGFATRTVPITSRRFEVELALAPQKDAVQVLGSTIDVAASQQGGSLSVITADELRSRNEPIASDLLRYIPGVILAQNGGRGSVESVFIRGGETKNNLVQINGVNVDSFLFGGLFDFSQIPADFLERVDVIRGPQSAVYGSYATSGVVNFVTRSPESGPSLDILAEGGSNHERHFAISGAGTVHGWGVAASASSIADDGLVPNNDFRNENLYLSLNHNWARQSLSVSGQFNEDKIGDPGPYGSNPLKIYSGLDRLSSDKFNFSDYLLHYQADVSPRVRQELFGSFFLDNSLHTSPYGPSFYKDLRGSGESRTVVAVTPHYTTAFGIAWCREDTRSAYITGPEGRPFTLERDQEGIYWDNRFQFGSRLFVNAGLRGEIFETHHMPADVYGSRPAIPGRTDSKVNPKLAGSYMLRPDTRLHASVGTGIRPPGGNDLAFSNNPDLRPERNFSYEAGVEQRLFSNRISLDATWFYNHYRDLIVSSGGSLSRLTAFSTDNLASSRMQGVEMTAGYRPARWLSLGGSYTWLETAVLAVNGGSFAQKYFYVGEPLVRRPKQSGTMVATFQHRKLSVNVVGYFRGQTLDVEPSFGISAGTFHNHGYQNLGVNVNYALPRGVTVYANLRNALDQHYEEIYGYPSPLLNFVTGVKFSLQRGR
jgi:outer membrane receptor protein involved in Fe transport